MNTFTACAYQFLHFLHVVKNVSLHTIRNYSLDLNDFKFFFESEILRLPLEEHSERLDYKNMREKEGKSFALDLVDKRAFRMYLAMLSNKCSSKKTVLRRLSALRSFFKYLFKEKRIALNPLDEIDSPKNDKRLPLTLQYVHVERLLAQPDTSTYLGLRDKAIMELFYSSALRISELVGLDRENFDRAALRLRLKGKGKKERIVPLTQTAAKWLISYIDHVERHLQRDGHAPQVDSRAIFLNKWGKRLSARSVDRQFKNYLCTSGLSGKITPHTIRHTIATHWLEKGMDLKTIQTLLGHSSLATTTIYTQVSSRLKREVYDKAHPLALLESQKVRESDKPDPVVEQSFI